VARGSVQRRFLQRPRWSSLDLDRNHGVAETSSFCESGFAFFKGRSVLMDGFIRQFLNS
jgi:hypothetical protein